MIYDWVESDSQTQSDTTTDSYAAVPAVEQTVSLQPSSFRFSTTVVFPLVKLIQS